MSNDIVCVECGSDEHLRGTPADDGLITLTCEACEVSWVRDPRPRCPTCGATELVAAPRVILEKSRGSQMSIQGIQREFLCRVCDAAQVEQRRDGYLPDRLPGSQ